MKIIISLFALLLAGTSSAQVQLNVTFHPMKSLETMEDKAKCIKQDKDLIYTLPLETFVIPSSEYLRFELLHIDAETTYKLYYNDGKTPKILTRQNPYYLVTSKAGAQKHVFKLKLVNSEGTSCENLKNHIRLTLEPM